MVHFDTCYTDCDINVFAFKIYPPDTYQKMALPNLVNSALMDIFCCVGCVSRFPFGKLGPLGAIIDVSLSTTSGYSPTDARALAKR